jgi:predicted amidohydrolase
MTNGKLNLAMVHEVFFEPEDRERLVETLSRARKRGADLALLPELPLNSWCPVRRTPEDEDAEEPDGPRHRELAEAAREAGIGVVGGVILRDPETGRRHNRALVFDARGNLVAEYDKLHLPSEEGYWESAHFEPGNGLSPVIDGFGMRFGLQICSDVNRPQSSHLLSAMGAEIILAPRATPVESYDRWKLVLRSTAVTAGCYVVSVNRPRPEDGVNIGGPSIAIRPDGEVLLEGAETIGLVELERTEIEQARRGYPGYLPVRADLYARGWTSVDE